MNKIDVLGEKKEPSSKRARDFPIGSILHNGSSSDTPYRIVTESGIVNLTNGSFYSFDLTDGFTYDLVTDTLVLAPNVKK